MLFRSDDVVQSSEVRSSEKLEILAERKVWHKPVISRIEIAQTMSGVGPSTDADNAPNS